ncbi:MAG: RNA 3'-terminal phosphate cyclase [Candidatus Thermoplasmatota archaeon]|nr:RNA 3'-terminal phosphate cyclase [Candidatus Thermoplasmatota archaeon]MBS3789637.1 RNA 3'-terminal phosphate cyclase [Candidatus Thermoplasmatota archaeon]
MIEIDGSYGEGGGQILRSALALSMVERQDIKVFDIRANRPNPGLSHQHLMAIKAASEICGASTEGVEKGSTEIIFEPGEIKGGVYNFDIGTAGSITLLLQALIPPALEAKEEITLKVRGGTDVKWSPPYDYFENVFLELLRRMNGDINSKLIKRGHYPKGGGKVKVTIKPSELRDISLSEGIDKIEGRAFVSELPEHIAERMKKQVLKEFMELDTSISVESYESASPGTGIVVWTRGGKVLGKGVLGEKGVPAEEVGEEAVEGLKKDIESNVDLDPNAADQLIPFLALLNEHGTLTMRKSTSHLETNAWLVNRFFDDAVELVEKKNKVEIRY